MYLIDCYNFTAGCASLYLTLLVIDVTHGTPHGTVIGRVGGTALYHAGEVFAGGSEQCVAPIPAFSTRRTILAVFPGNTFILGLDELIGILALLGKSYGNISWWLL